MEGPLAVLASMDQQAGGRVHGFLGPGRCFLTPTELQTAIPALSEPSLLETLLRRPDSISLDMHLKNWPAAENHNSTGSNQKCSVGQNTCSSGRATTVHPGLAPLYSEGWQAPTQSSNAVGFQSSGEVLNRIVGFELPAEPTVTSTLLPCMDCNDAVLNPSNRVDKQQFRQELGSDHIHLKAALTAGTTPSLVTTVEASLASQTSLLPRLSPDNSSSPQSTALAELCLGSQQAPQQPPKVTASQGVVDLDIKHAPVELLMPDMAEKFSGGLLQLPDSQLHESDIDALRTGSAPAQTQVNCYCPAKSSTSNGRVPTCTSTHTSLNSMLSCSLAASWVPQLRETPPPAASLVSEKTRERMLAEIAAHAAAFRTEPRPDICVRDSDVCPTNKCIGFDSPGLLVSGSSPSRDRLAPAQRSLLTANILNPPITPAPAPPAQGQLAGLSLFAQHMASAGHPVIRPSRRSLPDGVAGEIQPAEGEAAPALPSQHQLPAHQAGQYLAAQVAAVEPRRSAGADAPNVPPGAPQVMPCIAPSGPAFSARPSAHRARCQVDQPPRAQPPMVTVMLGQRVEPSVHRAAVHDLDSYLKAGYRGRDSPAQSRTAHRYEEWTWEVLAKEDKVEASGVEAADAFAEGMDALWFGAATTLPSSAQVDADAWGAPAAGPPATSQTGKMRSKIVSFLWSLLGPVE